MAHDPGEATMNSNCQETRDALLASEKLTTLRIFQEQLPTADVLRAVERRLPKSKDPGACRDYSEEAIPERDPAYRLSAGPEYEQATVEFLSAEVRRDLARRLQEMGMSRAKAVVVASW
jgi:hypothetical protein